ncbi:hypothetical protein PG993_005943 [Apiospora rasikravindrae]|uniref:Rhodopsin domain-containing protein n=1 Tax=Apiospora rasikravindrae TaxID=990691 RepID=A0ABR1TA78_9PEZI
MQDRGHDILAVGVFFLTTSWAIFLLRFFNRLRLVKHFKVDDWSLVIVQLAFTLYLACQIGSAVHGSGKRESDLANAEKSQALKWWYFTFQAYVVATCTLKVFVGIFLIRIAVDRRHLLILHVLTWGTLLFGIPYSIVMIIQCRPINTFWNVSPRTPGKCWEYSVMQSLTHVASALNCFADWVFGIIPFFIVRSLKITRPTKALVAWLLCFAAMYVLLSLLILGSAATIIRTFFIPRMLSGHDFLCKSPHAYLGAQVTTKLTPPVADFKMRRLSCAFGAQSRLASGCSPGRQPSAALFTDTFSPGSMTGHGWEASEPSGGG